MILFKVDAELSNAEYLTGAQISIVDIMVINEIETICALYKKEIPRDNLEKLTIWYDKLNADPAIQNINE